MDEFDGPELAEGQVGAGDWKPVLEPTPLEEHGSEHKTKSVEEIAQEVIAGRWGRGVKRTQKLQEAGYDIFEVNAEVAKVFNQ